jgi:hypothetical protein
MAELDLDKADRQIAAAELWWTGHRVGDGHGWGANLWGAARALPTTAADLLSEVRSLHLELAERKWEAGDRINAGQEVARLCHLGSNEIDFDYVSTEATDALAKLAEAFDETGHTDGDVA